MIYLKVRALSTVKITPQVNILNLNGQSSILTIKLVNNSIHTSVVVKFIDRSNRMPMIGLAVVQSPMKVAV